jgi:hypothetical protein
LLLIERGYVRREDAADDIRDRLHVATVTGDDNDGQDMQATSFNDAFEPNGAGPAPDEEEDGSALPDRLMIELTARAFASRDDQLAISSAVRAQPKHRPVLSSSLHIPIQGERRYISGNKLCCIAFRSIPA